MAALNARQDAPPEALEILKSRPETAARFLETFKYLPEGVDLPEAPPEAVNYLNENPMTAPQFKQAFGYLPAPEEAIKILRDNPSTSEQFKATFGYLPKSEISILERVGSTLEAWNNSRKEKLMRDQRSAAASGPTMGVSDSGYMGNDGKWYDKHQPIPQPEQPGLLANAAKGAGERVGDLFGNLVKSGGLAIEDVGRKVAFAGRVQKALMSGDPAAAGEPAAGEAAVLGATKAVADPIKSTGEAITRVDFNYVPVETWEKVKKEFSEGGPLSGSSWGQVAKYAAEQGVKSVPDMVAAVYALPAYITSRSVEMGATRAQNKGKAEMDLSDALEALPFAVGSAILERVGAKGMTQDVVENVGKEALKQGFGKTVAKESFKAGGKEGGTEFVQEGILEYVGEKYGTKAKMSLKEAFDRGLAGAVAGAPAGAAVGGAVAAGTELLKEEPREPDQDAAALDQAVIANNDAAQVADSAGGREVNAETTAVPVGQERRQPEGEAKRQETADALEQYRAVQADFEAGIAGQEDLNAAAEKALTLLYKDDLTGLQNFRAYHEYVADHPDHAIAKLDLDGFKELNDKYGHDGADGILRAVGAVITKVAKEFNVVAFRISTSGKGDEFAIMGADPSVLKTVGKAVQDELDSTTLDVINEKGETVNHPSIGVSYGVAQNPGSAETALKADKAARKASGKRQGLRDTPTEGAADMASPTGVPAAVSESGGVEGQPVTSEQIQAAKPNLPAEQRPSSTAYAGVPLDRAGEIIVNATHALMDKLGVAKEGVEVVKSDPETKPGPMSLIWSPSKLVKKYPKLEKYTTWARELAFEIQEGLRNAFRNRLSKIDDVLAEGDMFGKLSDVYRQNKRTMREIRLTEDLLGKRLTAQQMKDDFGARPAVIKAHMLMRATYDHAWTILSKTRELRGKLPPSYREGYLPHMFHNFFVIHENPLPAGAMGPPHTEIVGSGRTMAEAIAIGNQLKRFGGKGNIQIKQKQFKFPGEDVQAATVGDIEYFQMQRKLEKDFTFTLDEAAEIMEAMVRRKGRSRFFGNLLERKGVQGWEQDLDWVDRRYFNMVARYAALDRFKSKAITAYEREFGKFEGDKKDLAKYVKDYINDVNGTPTYIESMLNNGISDTWLGKFLGHYLGDRPILQLANGTANAVAIAKLGFLSPAAALVNASQLIGAYSLLGEKHFMLGNGLAMKAISGKGKGASTLRGILKQAGVDIDLGLESAAGYSSNAPLGKALNMTMIGFTSMEKYVRATTVLGAYRKALAGKATHQEAIEFAKGINRRVNFDYSIVDTPNFIRRSGPLGTVLFQFKKFPVKSLELMLSLKGPELARFWIPVFLVAGIYAFPGGEALKELLKAVTGKNGYGGWDAELELKGWLADWAGNDPEKQKWAKVAMSGVFSLEPIGVDISKRVGGSDFIPSRPSDFTGAGPSSLWRAVQFMKQGEWGEALRAVATSPGNLLIALTQGKFSTSATDRDRPIAEVTPGDVVKKAIGFRPYEEAKEMDVARLIKYENEQYRVYQAEAVDGIIESTMEYGQTVESLQTTPPSARGPLLREAKEKYDREIADVMENIIKHGLIIKPEQVENEVKNKNLTRSQRAFLNSSDIIKARTSRIYMFAQGSDDEE